MSLTEADIRAALDCLAGGWLTMGPRIAALEERFAAALGVEHAVAVSSGTAALHLACLAAGAGPATGVVVSALAPPATVNAVRGAGAAVQRADVLDPAAPALDAEAAAGEDTAAVVCSHLAGVPAAAAALAARGAARGGALLADATGGRAARRARRARSAAFRSHPGARSRSARAGSSSRMTSASRAACGRCARTR